MNMRGTMRSMRIHRDNENLKKAIERAVDSLYSRPDLPVRVTTRTAKFVLIRHETLTANGRIYSTRVRNVGAGVKELYLVEVS